MATATMDSPPSELHIVTLNCWGLKYLSAQRRERLAQIGRELAAASPAPDVVALQECWTQEDYRAIRRAVRLALLYGKFYFSGAFGGGLAVLSRWPIEESTMFRYPLNGRPTAFFRGDWFVGKGVACARIRYGPGEKHVLEVFNTHTHAPYEKGPNDSYAAHRTAQAWEMAKLLRGAAARGHLVVGLGDFNMLPDSLPHRLITAHAPVRDAWRALHPDSALGPADHPAERARRRPPPTAHFNLAENGATSDGAYNTWRWPAARRRLLGPGRPPVEVDPDAPDPRGKRLDYVFVGGGDPRALGGAWAVRDARVGMTQRHPELGCSLSDHFSVEVTLAFRPADGAEEGGAEGAEEWEADAETEAEGAAAAATAAGQDGETTSGRDSAGPGARRAARRRRNKHGGEGAGDAAVREGAFLETDSAGSGSGSARRGPSPEAQLVPCGAAAPAGLPAAAYDDVLAVLRRYVAREERQRRWRGAHFFAALALAAGCLAAVWFSPRRFVAFVLALASTLGLAAGTVDGLIALLFIGSELRALREFEWEITNARAAAAAAAAEGGGGGGRPPPAPEGDEDEKTW